MNLICCEVLADSVAKRGLICPQKGWDGNESEKTAEEEYEWIGEIDDSKPLFVEKLQKHISRDEGQKFADF